MARGYRRLSPAVEDEIWARLRAGHAGRPTARALGISTSGVHGYLVRCGGIRPPARRRSPRRLSLAEREEISRGLASGLSLLSVAIRFFFKSSAQGVSDNPPVRFAPISQNVARGGAAASAGNA